MPKLWCISSQGKLSIQRPADLFYVFQMADANKAGKKCIKKAGFVASEIEMVFEAKSNRLLVVFAGRMYTIEVVGVENKEQFNKLVEETDVRGTFTHDANLNGMDVLLTRLFDLLLNVSIDSIVHRDSARDIRQVANFPIALTASRLTIDKDPVTKGELNFIKEKFTGLKSLHFAVPLPDDHAAFPLQYPAAYIEKGNKLKVEELINMEAKNVEITTAKLKTSDMNRLIKSWVSNQLPANLESLTIAKVEKDTQNLFSGIRTRPWNQFVRSKSFPLWKGLAVDFSEAMDIERSSDGLLASVGYTETGIFQMVVWTNRYVEVPEGYGKSTMADQFTAIY
ncbi:Protein CBG03588 [Caenorhabditis briggsae]|uniref:Protein CBG03588 n=1 Tax=Caenorhabditis briggsae TaxID=6238 RepID=A8WVE4_CAEBR|nr:Protein CBG03588 [Caenorhabditis briggsae]CAP24455.1 Protein CBG03588 [Caenorhabditis briggsae]